ncbi:hypothetical protein SBBP1_330001 [Burkholderiales bacterium]|nr:hypothetical protein SBBP1_330001 [Burkholderiales bacterium]
MPAELGRNSGLKLTDSRYVRLKVPDFVSRPDQSCRPYRSSFTSASSDRSDRRPRRRRSLAEGLMARTWARPRTPCTTAT